MAKRKIKISIILDTKKIRQGNFIKQIPEFYNLREVIESNDWHNNDSVFNHTLIVLEKLKALLKDIRRDFRLFKPES